MVGIVTSEIADGYYRELVQSVPDSTNNVYAIGTFVGNVKMGGASIVRDLTSPSMIVMKLGQFPALHDLYIYGPEVACPFTRVDLTTNSVPGAASYVWNLPPGATSSSGSWRCIPCCQTM